MAITVQIMCSYHGSCIFNDDVCRCFVFAPTNIPRMQRQFDAVAVQKCGAGVAQPSKLKQRALAHICTSVLFAHPVNDVNWY